MSNSVNGTGSDEDSSNEQQEGSVFSKQFQSPCTVSFAPQTPSPAQDSDAPTVSDLTQVFNERHEFAGLGNETINRPCLRSHATSPVRQTTQMGCQAFNSALFIDFSEAREQHGACTTAHSPVNGQI